MEEHILFTTENISLSAFGAKEQTIGKLHITNVNKIDDDGTEIPLQVGDIVQISDEDNRVK
jgi:hypothetical protein